MKGAEMIGKRRQMTTWRSGVATAFPTSRAHGRRERRSQLPRARKNASLRTFLDEASVECRPLLDGRR